MYEKLNEIMSDLERRQIEDQHIQPTIDKFVNPDYADAINAADLMHGDALEDAIRSRDEGQIGYWVLRILECYARECNQDNINDAVYEREQELREAS